MCVDKNTLSIELPSNLSYKSALQFQPLRINLFNLGSESVWFLLTFPFLSPVLANRFLELPLHECTHFVGFHLDSDAWFIRICNCIFHHTCSYGFSLPTCLADFLSTNCLAAIHLDFSFVRHPLLQVSFFHCPILANRPADFLSISNPFRSSILILMICYNCFCKQH